jgi:hypothetical protein
VCGREYLIQTVGSEVEELHARGEETAKHAEFRVNTLVGVQYVTPSSRKDVI